MSETKYHLPGWPVIVVLVLLILAGASLFITFECPECGGDWKLPVEMMPSSSWMPCDSCSEKGRLSVATWLKNKLTLELK